MPPGGAGERADAGPIGAFRATTRLAKFAGDAAFDPGADPVEVLEQVTWHEPDGTPIADPARIAALEASLTEGDPPCP